MIEVADVNGDGKPDLLMLSCASCVSTAGFVTVLLNKGDGTFQNVGTYGSGGAFAGWIAVADVNGDGKPDLLVVNFTNSSSCSGNCNGTVGVLLGNGDGTFKTAVTYDSGAFGATSVAVADVNGDG